MILIVKSFPNQWQSSLLELKLLVFQEKLVGVCMARGAGLDGAWRNGKCVGLEVREPCSEVRLLP